MKKTTTLFLFLALNLLFANIVEAAVFNAVSNGFWHANTTWDQNSIPGPNDTVIIDGHKVTVESPVTIAILKVTNEFGPAESELLIRGTNSVVFTVTGNVYLIADNQDINVGLLLRDQAILNVSGNLNMVRVANNVWDSRLRLHLHEDTEVHVTGQLNFDYKSSGQGETEDDIYLSQRSTLNVNGTTTLIMNDGNSLGVAAYDSSKINLDSLVIQGNGGKEIILTATQESIININSDVIVTNNGSSDQIKLNTGYGGGKILMNKSVSLASTEPNRKIILETDGPGSNIEIKTDLTLSAESDSTLYVQMLNNSSVYLGGNLIRTTEFGNLISKDGGQLIFNGSGQQSIPGSTTNSSLNQDQFSLGDVVFSNTSGIPITLLDDLLFTDTLTLTTGNIVSTKDAMIILGPNAAIKGASESAYIEGPMKKIGSTGGQDFIFPIGDATTYAPMRISPVASNTSEYIASYDGDPPPFGENKVVGIVDQVTGNQTWSVEPAVGSEPVAVTLYWDNATTMGVELEEELIIVGLNGADTWDSKGNTDESLANPGHVTSIMLGDPPPFGEHLLTFGLETPGSLPVELTKFGAVQQKDKVYLEWFTSSEIDASHFELERSTDQKNFTKIYTTNSIGAAELSMKYSTLDNDPTMGMNYYRLKMVDIDGSVEYSHIEVVRFKVDTEILIYPNPVIDVLKIEGGKDAGQKTIEVYDRNGLLLYQSTINFEDGKFEISVDEINIEVTGTYFIRVIDGTESQVVKFLKI